MLVSFLGCDGSGKSAVIAGVSEQFRIQGIKVTQGHWRPMAFGTSGTISTADDPHAQQPRGTVSSLLKLTWLWFHWWAGWWGGLRRESHVGMVIFDRYHADLLVDPRRYRYGGPIFLARIASNLMPQPDLVLFLDADPDVLLSRKEEVTREVLESSRTKYLALCRTHPRFHIIDASQQLNIVIEDVLREISAFVTRRTHPPSKLQ